MHRLKQTKPVFHTIGVCIGLMIFISGCGDSDYRTYESQNEEDRKAELLKIISEADVRISQYFPGKPSREQHTGKGKKVKLNFEDGKLTRVRMRTPFWPFTSLDQKVKGAAPKIDSTSSSFSYIVTIDVETVEDSDNKPEHIHYYSFEFQIPKLAPEYGVFRFTFCDTSQHNQTVSLGTGKDNYAVVCDLDIVKKQPPNDKYSPLGHGRGTGGGGWGD